METLTWEITEDQIEDADLPILIVLTPTEVVSVLCSCCSHGEEG